MSLGLGIDIGSISIKVAVVGSQDNENIINMLAERKEFFKPESLSGVSDRSIALTQYRRIKGRPLD